MVEGLSVRIGDLTVEAVRLDVTSLQKYLMELLYSSIQDTICCRNQTYMQWNTSHTGMRRTLL